MRNVCPAAMGNDLHPAMPAIGDKTIPAKPLILVIDDLPGNVEVIGGYLSSDYDIQCAFSGPEALTLVEATVPDLVLLDVMMPGMDGYALCAAFKSDHRMAEVPIIFVTARDDSDSEAKALAAGAVDFIHKPINPPVLKARVATHLKLKRHLDELRLLATSDPLTGLANRRTLFERLDQEWHRAMRQNQPLSLLMIDVDFFKSYNDRYGHQQGDACLAKIARTIGESVSRADELAARYGGEEFVMILANSTAEQATQAAERVRAHIRDLNLAHGGSSVCDRVTVSIGVAHAQPRHDAALAQTANGSEMNTKISLDAVRLLHAADQALYAAKEGGRDRVACRTLEPQTP
jgi:diguanylate cyclase (GGDEF)-like protein